MAENPQKGSAENGGRQKHASTSSVVQLILRISAGFLLDRAFRRRAMLGLVLAAATMLFAGAVLLDKTLREHPVLFLFYWGVCGGVNVLSILLALYDMLILRRQERLMRKNLQKSVFGENDEA